MQRMNSMRDILILVEMTGASVRKDADGVPVAFRLFRPGVIELTQNGQSEELRLSDADIGAIINYHQLKGEEIPIDCEHLIALLADVKNLDESALLRAEPLLAEKGAAGFAVLKEEGNGELWAHVTRWTDRAKELLSGSADTMYKYFSPVVRGLAKPPLRVTSIALTNHPSINNLDALVAGDSASSLCIGRYISQPNQQEVTNMEALKRLCSLLSLNADTVTLSETESLEPMLIAAADAIDTARSETSKFLAAVKGEDCLVLGDDATLADAAGKVIALANQAKSDNALLSDLKSQVDVINTERKGAYVQQLLDEGKITAAQAKGDFVMMSDLATLQRAFKDAPIVVDPKRTVNNNDLDQGDTLTLSDTDVSVARACGLDPAKVAEANGMQLPK